MKKQILFFASALLMLPCCFAKPNVKSFKLKPIKAARYQVGELCIQGYNDNSVRLTEKQYGDYYSWLYVLDKDTVIKVAKIFNDICVENNISSLDGFHNFVRSTGKYSGNLTYLSNEFLEEYLVPKYGVPSGYKMIYSDVCSVKYENWNKETSNYDFCLSDCSEFKIEHKNWNPQIEWYDVATIIYSDYTVEKKNYNKEVGGYDYCVATYSDHTEEWKVYNAETLWYDYFFATYSDHTVEGKVYNKETCRYDYFVATYPDHTVEEKNYNPQSDDYESVLVIYPEYTVKFESKNWNEEFKDYDYRLAVFPELTFQVNRVDGDYCNVDIKDKNGNIVAYDHVITPLKDGVRDIEVFSDGVLYQYYGVQSLRNGEKLKFKSCVKTENGVQTKLKGGTLSFEEFYKKANPDVWNDMLGI